MSGEFHEGRWFVERGKTKNRSEISNRPDRRDEERQRNREDAVWFVADHSHITEQPTVSQRRDIVRRFGVQLMIALLGISCAFLAPALALSIFVALPIVFALTYRRRYY